LAVVSFGLPDLLSILVRERAMVADDRAKPDRDGVRVRAVLTRQLGTAMSASTPPQKPKRKKSKKSPPPVYAASAISVVTQNLINMVAVSAVSGTVLLGLLAAKHFWQQTAISVPAQLTQRRVALGQSVSESLRDRRSQI
jgi:hypothetical protein